MGALMIGLHVPLEFDVARFTKLNELEATEVPQNTGRENVLNLTASTYSGHVLKA